MRSFLIAVFTSFLASSKEVVVLAPILKTKNARASGISSEISPLFRSNTVGGTVARVAFGTFVSTGAPLMLAAAKASAWSLAKSSPAAARARSLAAKAAMPASSVTTAVFGLAEAVLVAATLPPAPAVPAFALAVPGFLAAVFAAGLSASSFAASLSAGSGVLGMISR